MSLKNYKRKMDKPNCADADKTEPLLWCRSFVYARSCSSSSSSSSSSHILL